MEINHACKNIHKGVIKDDVKHWEVISKNGITPWSEMIIQEVAELKAENEKLKAELVPLKRMKAEVEHHWGHCEKLGEYGYEHIKAENVKLKKQFEVIEQSTESCAYMELEIERLKSDDYKQEILRDNIDDAMGNWVDDVFGVSDLDEVKKQMDELKAENEKLRSADISGACDSDSDSESVDCDFCDKPKKHLVIRDAGYYEWTCDKCYTEQYPDSESESDDDFEKDKCEAKELIEQMKKSGNIGVHPNEQAGMNPDILSIIKGDAKLVSDPNKGNKSVIAIFK